MKASILYKAILLALLNWTVSSCNRPEVVPIAAPSSTPKNDMPLHEATKLSKAAAGKKLSEFLKEIGTPLDECNELREPPELVSGVQIKWERPEGFFCFDVYLKIGIEHPPGKPFKLERLKPDSVEIEYVEFNFDQKN